MSVGVSVLSVGRVMGTGVSTIAGVGQDKGHADGVGSKARFSDPRYIIRAEPMGTSDKDMKYFCISESNSIRVFNAHSGVVTTRFKWYDMKVAANISHSSQGELYGMVEAPRRSVVGFQLYFSDRSRIYACSINANAKGMAVIAGVDSCKGCGFADSNGGSIRYDSVDGMFK